MRFDQARPKVADPALLYSLAEFSEVIFPAFEAAGVRSVVEVGAEGGAFTERLEAWTSARGGRLVSIDPAPGELVRKLAAGASTMTLIEDLSHRALADLDACDAYLLDGDHNYFTVVGELDAIAARCRQAGIAPLIVLQDLAWPSGHRDQYYDPEGLPAAQLQPYDYGGVVPWSAHTGPGGFRGDGRFAFATVEGGPHNGVLSGLEDFLARSPGWEVISLPCIFGLAFVFRADAPWAPGLRDAIGGLDDHPLLARLEANRILLYVRLLEVQDQLERHRRTTANAVAALEAALDEVRSELEVNREVRRAAEEERDVALARAEAGAPVAPAGLRAAISALTGR